MLVRNPIILRKLIPKLLMSEHVLRPCSHVFFFGFADPTRASQLLWNPKCVSKIYYGETQILNRTENN